MKMDEMVLISVDDHVIEPPTVFENHIPDRWAERAPRLEFDPSTGMQNWAWEGGIAVTPFICAVVTLPPEEWGYDPSTLAEMRPGCWDSKQRVRDMDANGILASMCFPSFAGMGGQFLAECADRELAHACLQAYNDWHIDEWAGSHPGRFIPLPLSPIWDPELAAQEVRRVARKGATAITFSEAPESFGYPSIHSGDWDPLFAACCDEDIALAIHIASSRTVYPADQPDVPLEVSSTLPCWNALAGAANLLWCKSLVKFPDLKIALSESGTSWIPGFLDRMERQFKVQKWVGSDLGGLTPTQMWQRHFMACFICDPSGLLLRDRIGIDNIAYEVDYPHSDCTFPGSPEELWEQFELAKCSEVEIDKITHGNAARFLRFDPFAHRTREESTVAALRATATDVDLRTRSKADYKKGYEESYGSIG